MTVFQPKMVVRGAVSPYRLLRIVDEYIPKEYAENYDTSGSLAHSTPLDKTHIIDEPDQAHDQEAPAVHLQ